MEKKSQALVLAIIILLIGALVFLVWFLYQNIPGSPEELTALFKKPILEEENLETGNLSYKVKQFYPNMKFNHNSLSYKIGLNCDAEKKERMIDAFNELKEKIGVISFHEISNPDKPDIKISCSEEERAAEGIEEEFFIAGEGGAKEVIKTGRYNIITSGLILLYDNEKGVKCSWPNVELHELLHVFGFEHSQDKNSLMYPYLESCSQKLDNRIIQDLKQLYSQENLADIYFNNVTATKKGRYLDFNVTVKNSGAIKAENVVLSVLDNEQRLEDFKLNDIPFGAGVSFYVQNLKLRSRSSKNIELIIDKDNLIKEIDEGNNLAKLEFG